VFGLLSAQLLLTALVAAPIVLLPSAGAYLRASPWPVMAAMLASLGLLLTLMFSRAARHEFPLNVVLLAAFTACEGVLVGAVAAQYSVASVALAVALTGGVAGALAAYALQTKRDFTTQGGVLVACLAALILGGLVASFSASPLLHTALAAAGAALFGVYIVHDVQLIAGGAHTSVQLSPDEYVAGAIAVYLDVINLFIYILQLLNDRR
jgi:FtsH-binding integral membrane protein